MESPLDCKEIQPVHPKGNQSWIFIGRTDAEAETAILWLPDATLILGEIEGRRRRGQQRMRWLDVITDMSEQTHDGHEFEQAPGVGDIQGSLVCCSPWSRKESDKTEWVTEVNWKLWNGWSPNLGISDYLITIGSTYKFPSGTTNFFLTCSFFKNIVDF